MHHSTSYDHVRLEINLLEAQRHLTTIDEEAEQFTFRVFHDDKNNKGRKVSKIIHGSLQEKLPELNYYQNQGCGIFWTLSQ